MAANIYRKERQTIRRKMLLLKVIAALLSALNAVPMLADADGPVNFSEKGPVQFSEEGPATVSDWTNVHV